ncbi:MAG TPA: PqqD family protein [Phycisphaerales bacterium]|nr:PqqD family protein [Phycisphaerales bacterium]
MRFSEHTKIRNEKFGTVVFDTLTEKIFITDQIGGQVLQLIEQEKDLEAILDELVGNFDGDRETIEKDVIEFTEQLKANNIVTV